MQIGNSFNITNITTCSWVHSNHARRVAAGWNYWEGSDGSKKTASNWKKWTEMGVRVPGGPLDPPMGTIHEPYPRMFLFRLIYWANGQEKDIISATHEPRQVKDNSRIDK